MKAGIDIPIIAMCYNEIIGFYDELRGTTCIVTPSQGDPATVLFTEDILPPPSSNSMIVFDGINHFGYLHLHQPTRSDEVYECTTAQESDKTETYIPLDENFYKPFEPDYNDCENFIRAIGYEIDNSTLIGHRLLLLRSSCNKKAVSYRKHQIKLYKDVWENCIQKAQNRTRRKRGKARVNPDNVSTKKEDNIKSDVSKVIIKKEHGLETVPTKKSKKNRHLKLSNVCKSKPVHRKVSYQKEGRPYRYCCFVGCKKNNLDNVKFQRITSVPQYVPNDGDNFNRHETYHLYLNERKEQLDRCGLSRNDKRKNLRFCSDHK